MPDEVVPTGQVAPAATVAPVTPAPAAAAAPAPAAGATAAPAPAAAPAGATASGDPPADPNWLNDRIKQAKTTASAAEQKRILTDLGVANFEEAKAKLAAAKQAEDDKKTNEQKLADENKGLKTRADKADKLAAIVTERATAEMGALTEEQKLTVTDLAGDDPADQLKTIDRLRKGGLLPAPVAATLPAPAPAAGATGAPAPVAAPGARPAPTVGAPASTSSAGGAPPPASATAPNHKAVYDDLLKRNPVAAAQYQERYGRELYGQ